LLANTEEEKFITHKFCRQGIITQPFCQLIISMIAGFSVGETDYVSYHCTTRTNQFKQDSDSLTWSNVTYFQAHLEDYLQFTPAGCSFKQLVHYALGIQNRGINSQNSILIMGPKIFHPSYRKRNNARNTLFILLMRDCPFL